MIINGAGTTQKQSDWTVQGLFNEYFAVGKLTRRKKAFMKMHHFSEHLILNSSQVCLRSDC